MSRLVLVLILIAKLSIIFLIKIFQ